MLPILLPLPANLPLSMEVMLILSSSITIISQTKEGGGSTRQRPSGAHGLAAATWVEGRLMAGGPTMREVGTTPVEVTTPPTLKRTISPPTMQEVAMLIRGLGRLRSQS